MSNMFTIIRILFYWIFFLRNPPKQCDHAFKSWTRREVALEPVLDTDSHESYGVIIYHRVCVNCCHEQTKKFKTRTYLNMEKVIQETERLLKSLEATFSST